ncbi:MAG: hypothetical protein AB7I27_12010 [Bacteriovoracaceae bacterium]
MSQTILIESNEDLRKIYALNLSTFTGTDVIIRENADDAISLLKILPQISLVITESNIGGEETAFKIANYLKTEELETNLIVMGEAANLPARVVMLPRPVSWELLVKEATVQLGLTVHGVINKITPEFVPMPTHYFYDIQNTPCDVFIRIKKGPSDYQYVKRIHSKDSFNKDIIRKYEASGLKEFYISKDYIQYFTNFVINQLIQKLENKDLSLEDRILATSNGQEIVRDSVLRLEMNDLLIDLSESSISSMTGAVRNSPQISSILKFLFSNKISYAYQHSYLVSLMGHYILSKQNSYKHEHLHILTYASFFSDITLKTTKQMQISSIKELEEANLTEEEKKQVLFHAQEAVNIIKDFPSVDPHIKTVLLQSHGKINGVGFDDDPAESLHSLAKIFIVSDNFVKIFLNPYLPSTKKEILAILQKRYSGPSYHKILQCLEQKFQ